MGEQYRSLSSGLCSFLHSPVILSLLGKNILFNTLFSNTLCLCSSLNISDQVSHPYKTTGKIIVLYILTFIFLDSKLEDKRLHLMIASISQLQSALNVFLHRILICYGISKHLNSSTLPKELLSAFILWLRPAFWSRDMTMYLHVTATTSSPISFLAGTKASAFFFTLCTLPPNTFATSAQTRSWWVPYAYRHQ